MIGQHLASGPEAHRIFRPFSRESDEVLDKARMIAEGAMIKLRLRGGTLPLINMGITIHRDPAGFEIAKMINNYPQLGTPYLSTYRLNACTLRTSWR